MHKYTFPLHSMCIYVLQRALKLIYTNKCTLKIRFTEFYEFFSSFGAFSDIPWPFSNSPDVTDGYKRLLMRGRRREIPELLVTLHSLHCIKRAAKSVLNCFLNRTWNVLLRVLWIHKKGAGYLEIIKCWGSLEDMRYDLNKYFSWVKQKTFINKQ